MTSMTWRVAVAALPVMLLGCGGEPVGDSVALSTSWLECAARDIAGDDIGYVRLCPPGQCPGHFDISPSTVQRLRSSRLLLRFDFQQGLDDKARSVLAEGGEVVAITAPVGLCLPDGYLHACETVYQRLVQVFPAQRDAMAARMAAVQARVRQLAQDLRAQVHEAGLRDASVVTSGHQAAFARWLGLNVVATYSGADATSPRALEALIEQGSQAGVQYVIANLQEGRRMGESVAYGLHAPVVVFSNFPAMTEEQPDFDGLLRDNVSALLSVPRAGV